MTSNSKGKGKARQIQTTSRSPSPDLHGSGHLTNPNDDSASVGIPVPSDPYHNFAFPNTNVGATQSNVLPHNPFFSAPNPDFAPLNPYIAHSNVKFAPPNFNFDPLNPLAPASPNIIAPLPRLAHNTAFLEQIAESYRPLPFWQQRASEARASARPQPYDLMARQRSLRDDNSQVRQIEFEGDPLMGIVPELPRPNTRALRARPMGGPSTAVPPTAGPLTLRRNTRRPADPSPSDNAQELSNLINDEACVEMKNLILNDDFMLRGNELLSAMDDAIIIAMMKHSPDQVTTRQWIMKNSEKAKKSLRMVPVNLRNDIKHLARIIASGSWGLLPAFAHITVTYLRIIRGNGRA
ncbi:hypothetical protein EDD22DRAFT_960689 [Suillus occidentalis]|nr:hypothetical protein EDD22DRAFT_960689 [Suillus occidentalis]